MTENIEGLPPHNQVEELAPQAEVGITPEEIADLQRKAEVSSQNFERAKKAELKAKELEERLALLETNVPSIENGDEITALRQELSEVKGFVTKQQVLETYPQLKEVWNDYESYRSEPTNAGMSALTAAKSFLVEKDLLAPKRPGLEKPVGGGKRIAPTSGMTTEEARKLRESDSKKYRDAIKKGLIKFS